MGFGEVLRKKFVGFELGDERIHDLINEFKFLWIGLSALFNASDHFFQGFGSGFDRRGQYLTDFPDSFFGINIWRNTGPVFLINEQVLILSELYFLFLDFCVVKFFKLLGDDVACWLVL